MSFGFIAAAIVPIAFAVAFSLLSLKVSSPYLPLSLRLFSTMAPSSQNQSDAGLKRMLKLVNLLLSRPDSGPFREPVDWRGLELWDYPKIIKKMMDLGSVKRKLERGIYKNHLDCAEDIRLIWQNCMEYNQEDSDFWHLAKSFSRKFEDRYKKIQAECKYLYLAETDNELVISLRCNRANTQTRTLFAGPIPTAKNERAKSPEPKETISLERKSNFSAAIFRLNGMELGHVIRTIELECPEALEDLAENQVEINVDRMPPTVFMELETYLDKNIASAYKKRKK